MVSKTLYLIFVLLNMYDYLYIRVDVIFLSLRTFKTKIINYLMANILLNLKKTAMGLQNKQQYNNYYDDGCKKSSTMK